MLYRLIIVSEIQTLIFTVISQLIKGAKSLPLCYVIKMQQYKKRLYTAIDYRDKELLKEQYLFLKQYNEDTDEIRILYLRNYYLLWKVFYKLKEIIAR